MKRLTFRPVGRFLESYPPWLRELEEADGVYVIRDKASGETLYVGESHTGNLYATVTRHFQLWSGPTSGPSYSRSNVELAIRKTSPGVAVKRQDALICRLKPRDNRTNPCEDVPF
jgi:hypothetical protein